MNKREPESVELDRFVKRTPCPYCGGSLSIGPNVSYSNPLQYHVFCGCGSKFTIAKETMAADARFWMWPDKL